MGPHDVNREKFSKTVSKCTNFRPKTHPNIHGNFFKASTYTHDAGDNDQIGVQQKTAIDQNQ